MSAIADGSLMTWLYNDLAPVPVLAAGADLDEGSFWKGMRVQWDPESERTSFFVGSGWSIANSQHWEVPIIATLVYILMIPLLKAYIAKHGKWNVRTFAFYWNAGLSIFSWCGVFACVPVLLSSIMENGLFFTYCAPPYNYGNGLPGLFMALFIYSKFAELIDTVLLLLAGKPVIALQWWHHSTVLLYCWHSYSVRIATGAWFACMNYSVHSVMYGYFALMGTKYRKACSPYAIYITLAQLLQMLVGMFVTIKAVMYQAAGEECHVDKLNSILGLAMYASYFVLFLKLFIENYCMKKRSIEVKAPGKKPSTAKLLQSTSRQLTRQLSMGALELDSPSQREKNDGEDSIAAIGTESKKEM